MPIPDGRQKSAGNLLATASSLAAGATKKKKNSSQLGRRFRTNPRPRPVIPSPSNTGTSVAASKTLLHASTRRRIQGSSPLFADRSRGLPTRRSDFPKGKNERKVFGPNSLIFRAGRTDAPHGVEYLPSGSTAGGGLPAKTVFTTGLRGEKGWRKLGHSWPTPIKLEVFSFSRYSPERDPSGSRTSEADRGSSPPQGLGPIRPRQPPLNYIKKT